MTDKQPNLAIPTTKAMFRIRPGHILGRGVPRSGLLLLIILATSCATVPKESVELSYLIGQDLTKLQQSYDRLIQERFADHRARRIAYLENEWIPQFISEWIKDGRLVEIARGDVVFDDTQKKFVTPTPGREQQQLLSTIFKWSNAAIEQINEKRTKLLDPLNKDEIAIRAEARQAFDQLIQANAYVTAHLSSIRDVNDVQSKALERIGVKDLVGDLNNRLIQVSDLAEQGMDKIRRADNLIDQASEFRNNLLDNN